MDLKALQKLNYGMYVVTSKKDDKINGQISNTVFIGKVVASEIQNELEPMTYAYYHEIKKGLSPENAPTFIKEQ